MSFENIAANLGLDKEDLDELLELFTATSFSDIEKVNLGLKENNAQLVSQAAHSIKGASGNLGFEEIASLSKDIEMTAKEGKIEGLKEKADIIVEELKKIENAIKTN
ncbi:MAG: Hpt domain-containing protein [Desulfobacteraceae bacterium]|nr:Hpt domain-containing protein [Desulfobacteraceae bacterium]